MYPTHSVTDAEALFNQTKSLSERALQQAKTAYQDALEIYSQARNLGKPEVDVEQLRQEAASIKSEVSCSYTQ